MGNPTTGALASVRAGDAGALDAARISLLERLFESLLHDARNPLNALVINLDVLTEKLRQPDGPIPPHLEKNLRAIREQAFRVDGILRAFAGALAPDASASSGEDLSERVQSAKDLLSHELRRSRANLSASIQPGVRVARSSGALTSFLALESMLRAIARSAPGEQVSVALFQDPQEAVLCVQDEGKDAGEPLAQAPLAIALAAERLGGRAQIRSHRCEVRLPLVQLSKEVAL